MMLRLTASRTCKFASFSNLEKDVLNQRARAIFQGVALTYPYPFQGCIHVLLES